MNWVVVTVRWGSRWIDHKGCLLNVPQAYKYPLGEGEPLPLLLKAGLAARLSGALSRREACHRYVFDSNEKQITHEMSLRGYRTNVSVGFCAAGSERMEQRGIGGEPKSVIVLSPSPRNGKAGTRRAMRLTTR